MRRTCSRCHVWWASCVRNVYVRRREARLGVETKKENECHRSCPAAQPFQRPGLKDSELGDGLILRQLGRNNVILLQEIFAAEDTELIEAAGVLTELARIGPRVVWYFPHRVALDLVSVLQNPEYMDTKYITGLAHCQSSYSGGLNKRVMDTRDNRVLPKYRLSGQFDTVRRLGAYELAGAMQSAVCECFGLCRCKGQRGYSIDGIFQRPQLGSSSAGKFIHKLY